MKILSVIVLCFMVVFLMGCQKSQKSDKNQQASESQAPAVQEGQKLLNERCTVCHTLDRVKNFQKTADKAAWEEKVSEMMGKGAKINATEKETLIGYLLANPLK